MIASGVDRRELITEMVCAIRCCGGLQIMVSVIGVIDCPLCGARGAHVEEDFDRHPVCYWWRFGAGCHGWGSLDPHMAGYQAVREILEARGRPRDGGGFT
jgi:hypothetical protein